MSAGSQPLRVFIGWDSREDIAYQVARKSILDNASVPVEVMPIKLQELVDRGLYTREVDPLASTEFTYSRFLVPHLAGFEGWALFVDCDFLFFGDVAKLEDYMNSDHAVVCAKHDYNPTASVKMDGAVQTTYPRKNWSSFMLYNCGHPSTQQLTPERVNAETGAYLHRMQWAADDEIGELPYSWNFLEGWYEKFEDRKPDAVHYTRGGPWFKDWQAVDYGDEWRAAAKDLGWSLDQAI
ncbi:MAG: glycosyltransferase [Pseudomonadota bacterium]